MVYANYGKTAFCKSPKKPYFCKNKLSHTHKPKRQTNPMTNKNHMKTIIIEDCAQDAEDLVVKLRKYPQIELICTCENGEKGLQAIIKHKPDLVFLDIEQPDMTGLQLIDTLDKHTLNHCQIIIYTNYPDYMLEAFRNHAFDFLIKPIKEEDLDSIIQRVQTARDNTPHKKDGNIYKAESHLLMYINSTDIQVVRLRDIGAFCYDSSSRCWEIIIDKRQKPIRLKRNVNSKMLLSLHPDFIQVSQKYIINFNYLFQVIDGVCSFYPPFHEIDFIKLGSHYRRNLFDRFTNL